MQTTRRFLANVFSVAIIFRGFFCFAIFLSTFFLLFSSLASQIQAANSGLVNIAVTVEGGHILPTPTFTVAQAGATNLVNFSGSYQQAKTIKIHLIPLSPDASPEQTYSYDVPSTDSVDIDWNFATPLANGTYKAQIQIITTTDELSPLSSWKNFTVYVQPLNPQPNLNVAVDHTRVTFSGTYHNPLCLIFEITPLINNQAQNPQTYTECLSNDQTSGSINWVNVTFLDPSQYQARVQIKLANNILSPWSEKTTFTTARIPTPDFSVSTDQETKNVTWDGQYSTRYLKCLEIKIENLTDPKQYSSFYWPTGCTTGGGSNEIINNDPNGGNWWRFTQVLLPGQYQTQIRVTDSVGSISDWSSWKTFIVKSNLEAPKLTATINGNQIALTGNSVNGETCIWAELKNIETGEVFPQEICQNITDGIWQIIWQDTPAGSYIVRARLEQKNALQSPWSEWLGSFKVAEISQCLADGTGCEELVVIGEVKSATLNYSPSTNFWRDQNGNYTPIFWITSSLGLILGGAAIFGLWSFLFANVETASTFFYTPLVFEGTMIAIPQVKIRIYNAKTGNLVKTLVSNKRGHLRIVLDQGSYRFKIDHGRGQLPNHLPKSSKIKKSIKKRLVLNNQILKVNRPHTNLRLYFAIKFD